MVSKNASERIISDYFCKTRSPFPEEAQCSDEKKAQKMKAVQAVHRMYGWLNQQDMLGKVSFVYKNYEDIVYFAFDAGELAKYRSAMETSGVEDAKLACQLIFDTECTPCRFSGAIQFIEPMDTFREVAGVVSRSWECLLIKHLNNKAAYDVLHIHQKQGTRAAVMAMYKKHHWADCK